MRGGGGVLVGLSARGEMMNDLISDCHRWRDKQTSDRAQLSVWPRARQAERQETVHSCTVGRRRCTKSAGSTTTARNESL